MPLQSFVDNSLPTIKAAWLNAIDAFYFTLFNSATTAAQARTALLAAKSGVNTDLTSLTAIAMATNSAINATKTTVASASGPDIWSSTGNVIDYTGTVTATSFAAAPQAGVRRTLVCAGAAVFTAGANFIIAGVTSGDNFTASGNTRIEVVALTTTQFLLTPLVGVSRGTATSVFTWNGAAGGSTGALPLPWQAMGNFITIKIPAAIATTGTTSTGLVSVTALPAAIRPAATQSCAAVNIINSGTGVAANGLWQVSTGGLLTLLRDGIATAFTDGTSCGVNTGQTLTYCLA